MLSRSDVMAIKKDELTARDKGEIEVCELGHQPFEIIKA